MLELLSEQRMECALFFAGHDKQALAQELPQLFACYCQLFLIVLQIFCGLVACGLLRPRITSRLTVTRPSTSTGCMFQVQNIFTQP